MYPETIKLLEKENIEYSITLIKSKSVYDPPPRVMDIKTEV